MMTHFFVWPCFFGGGAFWQTIQVNPNCRDSSIFVKKNNMGTGNIQVSFPQELGFALKMQEPELADEMRRLAIVKLYELSKLSSGKAAQLLGISRVAFLELLGTYQVSILGNPGPNQLEQDLLNA